MTAVNMVKQTLLPLDSNNPNQTFNCPQLNVRPDTSLLKPEKIDDFMAGEMRVNEHPFLTTLHIIFVKEHNRIAKLLKEYLPSALHDVSYSFDSILQKQASMSMIDKWRDKYGIGLW